MHFRVWLPHSLVPQVINIFHDEKLSSHLGVRKTYFRIEERVYWEGMRKDVTEYVKSCPKCQESFISPNPPSIGTSMVPEYLWEVITIDFLGPYPKGTNQNQYLFVVVDCFTMFVELFPLKEATSAAVIQKLWQLCCRRGFPKVIVSDNETQFTSKDYTIWCKTFGITPFHISPYHAQANMTERYDRTIEKMSIASIDRMKDWDKHLDELSFALRTCVSDATSMTPSYLFTGREFRTPFDNLMKIDLPSNKTSNDLLSWMSLTDNIVRDNILSSEGVYLKNYNAKTKQRIFSIGDLVTVRSHKFVR